MNETNSLIQIKGLRDGLLVSLDDAPWDEQRTALDHTGGFATGFLSRARAWRWMWQARSCMSMTWWICVINFRSAASLSGQ